MRINKIEFVKISVNLFSVVYTLEPFDSRFDPLIHNKYIVDKLRWEEQNRNSKIKPKRSLRQVTKYYCKSPFGPIQ